MEVFESLLAGSPSFVDKHFKGLFTMKRPIDYAYELKLGFIYTLLLLMNMIYPRNNLIFPKNGIVDLKSKYIAPRL